MGVLPAAWAARVCLLLMLIGMADADCSSMTVVGNGAVSCTQVSSTAGVFFFARQTGPLAEPHALLFAALALLRHGLPGTRNPCRRQQPRESVRWHLIILRRLVVFFFCLSPRLSSLFPSFLSLLF